MVAEDYPIPKGLLDHNDPVTIICVFIYQMENFAYFELNRSCRFRNESKVPTLGPWAMALGCIIGCAQIYRDDFEIYDHRKQYDLWRGGGMTEAEIYEFLQMVGLEDDDGLIMLHGYTSCSLSKNIAMSFAWENSNSGHKKVLFHFKWKSDWNAFYMNAGAYDYEKEVLLYDGTRVMVDSVRWVTRKDTFPVHIEKRFVSLKTPKLEIYRDEKGE